MSITLRNLKDKDEDYSLIYEWCQNKNVYEWFEQRILSFEEIKSKYKKKLELKKQDVFIVQYNEEAIGLVQIYKFDNSININTYKNIYEFDIFIGNEEYLSKGIGTQIVNYVTNLIYLNYKADAIILRPFKRNIRAIKCYQKCGYELLNEYEDNDTIGNKEIVVVMINKKN